MTTRTRIWISVITVLVSVSLIFLFATCCKHVFNRYERAVSKRIDDSPSQSIDEARERGALVSELSCTPNTFTVDATPIVIGECWIEQRSKPVPHLVWSTKYELLDGYWFNFKLDEGASLFDEKDRLRFRFENEQLSNPENRFESLPANRFVAFSRLAVPTIPMQMDLIDRKAQLVVGPIVLTKK